MRQRLADQLIACGQLDGRTREQVRAMLGRADDASATHWNYELGEQRVIAPLDSEYLNIEFDGSGRVRRAILVNG